jgi:ribosome biogenesis SPOUT family RNA methylase Rps3
MKKIWTPPSPQLNEQARSFLGSKWLECNLLIAETARIIMKYIIEHMEEGFSEWVRLEYLAIAEDVGANNFYLTSISETTSVPEELVKVGIQWTHKDITEFATVDERFSSAKVCLLDPSAKEELVPSDNEKFDYFLFGGILGDHPPRDRTGELRKHGFVGRHLGKTQMTTDTAVRVTQIVLKDGSKCLIMILR